MFRIYFFIGIFIWANHVMSQSPTAMSYQHAVDTLLAKHPSIMAKAFEQASFQKLAEKGYGLSQPVLTSELGQFNSRFFDAAFGIQQSFSHPKVFKVQRTGYQIQQKQAAWSEQEISTNLRKELATLYAFYTFQEDLAKLYTQKDSLYKSIYDIAQNRLRFGESDALDIALLETQLLEIQNELQQIESDKRSIMAQLQTMLGFQNLPTPDPRDLPWDQWRLQIQAVDLEQIPTYRKMELEQDMVRNEMEQVKANLLPELSVAYRNVGIQGTGADDIRYPASARFHSVQFGISIPIFQQHAKKDRAALDATLQQKMAERQSFEKEVYARWAEAYQQYTTLEKTLQTLEQKILPSSVRISELATNKWKAGQLGLVEYHQLLIQKYQNMLQAHEQRFQSRMLLIQINHLTNTL